MIIHLLSVIPLTLFTRSLWIFQPPRDNMTNSFVFCSSYARNFASSCKCQRTSRTVITPRVKRAIQPSRCSEDYILFLYHIRIQFVWTTGIIYRYYKSSHEIAIVAQNGPYSKKVNINLFYVNE